MRSKQSHARVSQKMIKLEREASSPLFYYNIRERLGRIGQQTSDLCNPLTYPERCEAKECEIAQGSCVPFLFFSGLGAATAFFLIQRGLGKPEIEEAFHRREGQRARAFPMASE